MQRDRKSSCGQLRQALLDSIEKAERDLALAKASLVGDSAEAVLYTASRLAGVGRSVVWDGEVLERNTEHFLNGYRDDERLDNLQ